ncbi:MAG: hypothetical protein HY856_11735, partial [Burkholderiales bacterium]|nr:hypothetical protein [Burkholderiales bacterium]
MTTRRLWQLVLIAALLQVAVPALRELVPLWLRAPFSSRSVGMEGRCWPRPPPPTGELGALARVDYSLPADPPRIWQAFETALARAPGSEALLIERARRIPLTQAAWARRAALAVTDAFPDNAAGWYLLAAADLAAGD